MKLPPLSLYIHLPWCERKCPYCDFNSHELSAIPQRDYVSKLLEDLAQDVSSCEGRRIDSIFIGGGTPSLFDATSIEFLLQGVRDRVELSSEIEITLEANPSSAEAERFAGFHAAGINRLSIGIQSFNEQCLQALGRVHNSEEAFSAAGFARAAGFTNFNLDLMHGLPGQSAESARQDLQYAIDCQPAHISWYQLTIEPNTVFHKQPPTLPVENTLAEIQQTGSDVLAQNGFRQYEVSAYATEGATCYHNHNYWCFGDYIGIGAGAHGKLTAHDGNIKRYSKRRQPDHYLTADASGLIATQRELTPDELPGEFVMNALRLREGFSLFMFEQRTGLDRSAIEPTVKRLCEQNLLEHRRDHVATTSLGYRFLDTVIAEFFAAS